jgi:muramoyltetrapeptide carboxypeptidase
MVTAARSGARSGARARRASRAGAAAPALPPPLAAGDAVALFSPSSHARRDDEPLLAAARAILSGWELAPLPLSGPPRRHLYLAGSDAERAAEFQRLYCDPTVKALFATRGGYGAARMLPHLDAARIAAAPPKAVVGMSDVVALFAWLRAAAGLATVHGPCLAAPSLHRSAHREENLAHLRGHLFEPARTERLPCRLLHAGRGGAPVRAPLVGGNLAVLASLLGTPWALETDGCLLFLEDVNEPPYRIDRLLTQLRQAGRLDGVAGVVFGHLQNCDGDPPGLLADVLRDLFHAAPYPVVTGLEAGHGDRNRTLPLGGAAELDWSAAAADGPATLTLHPGVPA